MFWLKTSDKQPTYRKPRHLVGRFKTWILNAMTDAARTTDIIGAAGCHNSLFNAY